MLRIELRLARYADEIARWTQDYAAVVVERDEARAEAANWKRHCDSAIDVRHDIETEVRANLALRDRQLAALEAEVGRLVEEQAMVRFFYCQGLTSQPRVEVRIPGLPPFERDTLTEALRAALAARPADGEGK